VLNLYRHRKENAIDRLNPKKNRLLCASRDLNIINAKIWVLLCKLLKYKSNFQNLLKGQNARIQVIMTSHENLQTYPKLHQIHLGKDKRIQIPPLLKILTCKAISFGFLNLNLKTIL
jgi:hypothetical protein